MEDGSGQSREEDGGRREVGERQVKERQGNGRNKAGTEAAAKREDETVGGKREPSCRVKL